MPGSMPATSQLEWLSSTTAMIVLFWSRATRDLLRSFGWGIAALLRENAATKLPFHRRPPHSVFRFHDALASPRAPRPRSRHLIQRERRLLEWPPSDLIGWSGRNCSAEPPRLGSIGSNSDEA